MGVKGVLGRGPRDQRAVVGVAVTVGEELQVWDRRQGLGDLVQLGRLQGGGHGEGCGVVRLGIRRGRCGDQG